MTTQIIMNHSARSISSNRSSSAAVVKCQRIQPIEQGLLQAHLPCKNLALCIEAENGCTRGTNKMEISCNIRTEDVQLIIRNNETPLRYLVS